MLPSAAIAISMPVADGVMPAGVQLPWVPHVPYVEVAKGSSCYSAAGWFGFTKGIVQNAPNFMRFDEKITDPDGIVILDTAANAGDAGWKMQLWDPDCCPDIGTQPGFNAHLGAPQYFTPWFTKTFTVEKPGVYTVKSTVCQTRPATDLIQVSYEDPETGELVTLKKNVVYPAGSAEYDWTFTVK